MKQHDMQEAIDRTLQIERLECSMSRWRELGMDRTWADDYAYYQELLCYLRDGGAYTIRHYLPASTGIDTEEYFQSEDARWFQLVGLLFASISRTSIGWSKRRGANPK